MKPTAIMQAIKRAKDFKGVQSALQPNPNEVMPEGRENLVKTAKGTKVETGFSVIEASKLIVSHDSQGNENPDYPQELQPRDRGRHSSQNWVQKTSRDLDPDMLGRTRRADSGAPIIGPDRVVESGNGRTMAIIMAYKNGDANEYKQWLIDEADVYGISPAKIQSMIEPVLVRVRTSKVDRAVFAVEANQDDKLSMTATEKARSDAKRLDSKLMMHFDPGANGDLLAASNRDFISGFLKSLGDTEAAQYLTSTGQPTGTLVARLQAAIFAKAYEDERLLEIMADTAKPEIQNIVTALNSAAPYFIEAREANQSGVNEASEKLADSVELSLDNEAISSVIDATNIVRAAKEAGQSVEEYVSQQGLFGDVDPGVAAIAVFIAQNNRSAKRMGVAFKAMAEFVKRELVSGNNFDIFGARTVSMVDVVAAANAAIDEEYGEGNFAIASVENADAGGLFESAIDDKANEAATSNTNDTPEPTQAQMLSGNYKKGSFSLHGLKISIENPRGSERKGVDPDGKEWAISMTDHYGYINGTQGADGDQVDVYVGKNTASDMVYVVDQLNQQNGTFDEHKVMLGFGSKREAINAYKKNFTAGWRVGKVTGAPIEVFKEWLDSGKTRVPFTRFVAAKGKKHRRVFESVSAYSGVDTPFFI